MTDLWMLWLLTIPIGIAGYLYLDRKRPVSRQEPKTMAETLRQIREEHESAAVAKDIRAVTHPPTDSNQPLTLAESIRQKIIEAEAQKKADRDPD
jgi:hypothetical protein